VTREPVTVDDLDSALVAVLDALTPALGADWSVPAAELEWSCRQTIEHVADDMVLYAALVTARAKSRYPAMLVRLDEDAAPPDYLEVLAASGRILSTVIRAMPPEVEVWHTSGFADPEAMAAMGVAELVLHAHDLCLGLGLPWTPPAGLSARVLGRLFPRVALERPTTADGGVDGRPADWATLLWATGRISTPTRARLSSWRWHNQRDAEYH
jgi:hypothetical protein